VALVAASPSAGAVKEGKVAPSFEATTFDGAEIKLSDFKGDVLVINIWATWCACFGNSRTEISVSPGQAFR
jgi:AhpC/TSA family